MVNNPMGSEGSSLFTDWGNVISFQGIVGLIANFPSKHSLDHGSDLIDANRQNLRHFIYLKCLKFRRLAST